METQKHINYQRVAAAIEYMRENFRLQPDMNEVAAHVNMSLSNFNRLFAEWAGTSPKKFLQYISLDYAKGKLKDKDATLFDTAFDVGFSSTSRLHDLFITIEGMTPAEYKNGGQNLRIHYSFNDSPFGPLIIASTPKGICYLAFFDNGQEEAINLLRNRLPKADFQERSEAVHTDALGIFQKDWSKLNEIKLHLRGTDFQLKVWECLLKIPQGNLSSYGRIAQQIGHTRASRAIGTAIGSNPVAFLIPCHRVIQSSGKLGGYMWGEVRKSALIGWENAQVK